MNTPADLKYTQSDEWVKVNEKVVTIGITDYAQNHLSDLVYCGLEAEEGSEVAKGDLIVEIDSVKASAEVNSPVTGKIIEKNPEVINSPETINHDPYGKGWLYGIEVSKPEELNQLMSAEEYDKYCETRGD